MDVQRYDMTRLFFHYLREADYSSRHFWDPTQDQPPMELLGFLHQAWGAIFLGHLMDQHDSLLFGLWPDIYVMDATIRPNNEEEMVKWWARRRFPLIPPHLLGLTVFNRGRQQPGERKIFAQLGTVMVHPYRSANPVWHRTNFVFAAEIDGRGKAAQLWMLESLEIRPSDPLGLLSLPWYNFRTLAPYPDWDQPEFMLVELRCDEGWRERTETGPHLGLGNMNFRIGGGSYPMHFVRVVQEHAMRDCTPLFHATEVWENRAETRGATSGPFWVCAWYPVHQENGCPAIGWLRRNDPPA